MRRRHRRIAAVLVALAAWAGSVPAAEAGTSAPLVYQYNVRGKGNTSDLEEFAAAAAETYADQRGWNLGGPIQFERVASGGDFTLWLSANDQMATFGGACDIVWSCRSGDNVVVNEDRWLDASPAWNEAGGSLRDYRHMVVNHETGHWLGFGHATCGRPGAAAAVMQQQSMGLQGCAPNPWPLAEERAAAGRRLPAPLLTEQAEDAIRRDTGNILRDTGSILL
jgi:hypothetical protein